MRVETLLALLLLLASASVAVKTGFWYSNSRPPVYNYESVQYANLTVKINQSIHEGPGQHLVKDPYNTSIPLYVGRTINRETFDTQFVLDISYAIGIDVNRVFVVSVEKGDVAFQWESNTVIVSFIFLEANDTTSLTLLEAIAELNQQIQIPDSKIYRGTNVTLDIDPLWGLQEISWDVSLRLSYNIDVIGGSGVREGYYLNQGSLYLCDTNYALNYTTYCEFERFFEDDVAKALNISVYRVQILFIKTAALDASIVYFRITPPKRNSGEVNVTQAIADLYLQVADRDSALYRGNVTLRTDPTWGVSQKMTTPRVKRPWFTREYYEYDADRLDDPMRKQFLSDYDRCKANRRCNWGIVELNQTTNDARFFQRLYERGSLYDSELFLDFEDWRMGSRGFNWNGDLAPMQRGANSATTARAAAGVIRGAHFFPFEQESLGPDVPCFLAERNQGLILDRALHRQQIYMQQSLVADLEGRIAWLTENIETATMGPQLRSRRDVERELSDVRADFSRWLQNEQQELVELNSSQCVRAPCEILFNTSSAVMTGAINVVGQVKKTVAGTEVALFTFNSIYLGPEVKVTVVGQRALALLSKTSAVINATISAMPGTLGGFQGGGSVARLPRDALNDQPTPIFICDLNSYCAPNNRSAALATPQENLTSNNVNGPGSGNVRVHPFIIRTAAPHIPEIQTIRTSARPGQTLQGGFVLSYKQFSTVMIPHDVSALQLKYYIEDGLNLINPNSLPLYPTRADADNQVRPSQVAGVGTVFVTRSSPDAQEGFTWNITFTSAVGDIPQLQVSSFLVALDAQIEVRTLRDGNEIGGFFTLNFAGARTAPIPAQATAAQMQRALLSLPMITTAVVNRTDPTGNCKDGFCENGPTPAGGLEWYIVFTTDLTFDNLSPTSPSSPDALRSHPAPELTMTDESRQTLSGMNATVTISRGLATARYFPQNMLDLDRPFSLAFGGAGGSYGGPGGAGYGLNPTGPTYNDEYVSDLLGGSGGCMAVGEIFEINAASTSIMNKDLPGLGGDGGGAIEIIAANSLTIGSFGKISCRGGDGGQSSSGGGGGGSGGAIVLAAGSGVLVQGELDVTGGDGGYGGNIPGFDGGGGGGGRIALYADSVVLTDVAGQQAKISVGGGRCGKYQTDFTRAAQVLNISASFISSLPALDGDMQRIVLMHMEMLLAETGVRGSDIEIAMEVIAIHSKRFSEPGKYRATEGVRTDVNISLTLSSTESAPQRNLSQLISTFESKLPAPASSQRFAFNETAFARNIADVWWVSAAVAGRLTHALTTVVSSFPSVCDNVGASGSFYSQALMTSRMVVAQTVGAERTSRALFLSNREETNSSSGSLREAPFAANGPVISFAASRPSRITYYTRTDAVAGQSNKRDFGSLFTLISRGEPGLNVSNVIGVYFGWSIMHGANFGSAVDEKTFLKRLVTIDPYSNVGTWYKIDIKIQWAQKTYSVLVNDTILATNQPFVGGDIDGIRLSVYRAVDVWFDEIYVGFDNSLEFSCPISLRTGTSTAAPVQRGWSYSEVHGGDSPGYTEYKTMQRHYNFLATTGSIPFDGQGAVKDFQDIKLQYADGDYPRVQGRIHAGALVYLQNNVRSARSPLLESQALVSDTGLWTPGDGNPGDGRHFWYTEYDYVSNLTETLNGGIAACSSQDLNTWRFEGFVFHYTNLSDMVFGQPGPFKLERPKVLFNELNKNYVMWAAMDDQNRSFALNAITTSPFPDGPFLFRRSHYPDGNQTRDQVIFNNPNDYDAQQRDNVVLARTYYQTVQYVLPQAMMQPVWESAKTRNGTINYRSNYHRANYHTGYDNYNDIYLQRWRKEDKPYEVICENKLTGARRYVPQGNYTSDGFICNDPSERKIVVGQGSPIITSRFVSPNDSENSWWRPTSVPAVQAQNWANNYIDGFCGIRKLNDDFAENDPRLAYFQPADRTSCSNIADNPIHDTLQDKLIGVLQVVLTRRAKFLAMSRLTPDYLDTTGELATYEGELESGNLISLLTEKGQFGFAAGLSINSTYAPPQRSEFETALDYRIRFSQYVRNYNDRASYSLACVLDGVCPVNFKQQLYL